MKCIEAKERLVAYLSEDLGRSEKKALIAHLASCSTCSEEKEALESLWNKLGTLPEAPVPADLQGATLSRIEALLPGERLSGLWGPGNWRWVPIGALLGAVGMAFLSLWVLRGVTAMEQLSAELVFLCAALWTGVLGLSFLFGTGAVPSLSAAWRIPAQVALSGFGFALLGIALCPKMSLIEWWETVAPGEFLLHFGPSISHAAFGALYAFIPFFLAVLLFRKKLQRSFFSQLLAAAVLYFALLVPGIFLQALPLSAVVFLSWTGGSALGVTMAALGSAGFFRPASSA